MRYCINICDQVMRYVSAKPVWHHYNSFNETYVYGNNSTGPTYDMRCTQCGWNEQF